MHLKSNHPKVLDKIIDPVSGYIYIYSWDQSLQTVPNLIKLMLDVLGFRDIFSMSSTSSYSPESKRFENFQWPRNGDFITDRSLAVPGSAFQEEIGDPWRSNHFSNYYIIFTVQSVQSYDIY
jgi:hypothetical protein